MAEKDQNNDPIEKRSMSKYMFVLGSLFFVVAAYSLIDEGVVRRTWKGYQRDFNKQELALVEKEYQALLDQKAQDNKTKDEKYAGVSVEELPDDPAELSLTQIRLKLENALIGLENDAYKALRAELKERQITLQDVTEVKGFAKADQDEIYYLWKHALHEGHHYEDYEAQYWALEKKIAESDEIVREAQARVDQIKAQLAAYDDVVSKWRKAEEAYFSPMDKIERRLKNIKGRSLDIHQVVISDLGIVDVVEWGKVDRCMSCHTGVDRKGFEDFPAPFATHPHRDLLLKKHPTSEFGCTTCHWGQGRATQIKHEPLGHDDFAHGFEHHWQKPLLQGDFVQSSCFKCHADQWKLEHAPVAMKGKHLFMEMGCIGCHNVKGFEDYPKAGPSLERVGSKVHPEWIVDWILNPRAYDPHTRMPQAPLEKEGAVKIASYLLQETEDYDYPYGNYPGNGSAERGQELFSSVGCFGCHALDDKGSNFAPTLDRIMEKTTADWVYNWIQDPKSYHAGARMPRLRLTEQEAADITAYLASKGEAATVNEELRAELAHKENKEEGYLLITQYGCYGCHNIKGTESLSKLSVDLSSFGKKTTDKLDFGDTEIPITWEDWTFNKIKNPQVYLHERASSRMPKFPLEEEDIHALVVFLKGLRGYTPPERFVQSKVVDNQKAIDDGRRLVRRLNCIGCHAIEGEGGAIASLYEDPGLAPPNLAGQGAKVQPAWLFSFLKNPGSVKIRPWLDIRMPTFDFTDEQAETLVKYFAAVDGKDDVFISHPEWTTTPEMLEAGAILASSQYFSCYSCHQQGDKKPAGPKSMWAPDLAMVPERIRPDFIPPWVQNPSQFTPGVRMPAFLPEPGTGPPNILGGDIDRQAEAIRDFLIIQAQKQGAKPQAKR